MPKYRCPYPECKNETEDVKDELAAVLLTVHSNGTHVQTSGQPATQATTAKVEKVRRPTISSAGSGEEWSYFLTRWKDYAEATKLEGKDMVIQLLECCKDQLRKDLTRNAGGSLTNKSMDEVMAAIQKLAVREENTMVARVQLHNMRQDRDETIRSFGARLRGQVSVCKFLIKCPGCRPAKLFMCPVMLLSREACTALRMISENFPIVGETLSLSKTMALDVDPVESQQTTPSATPESALNSPCNCPAARHHHKNPPNYHSQLQRLTGSP